MRVNSCLPIVVALLLAPAAIVAAAETPLASLPDPIAPAVIGRPLDQIGPVRKPAAKRPAAALRAPTQHAQGKAAAGKQGAGSRSAAGVAGVPPRAVLGGPRLPPAAPPALAQDGTPGQRQAKQAVDDRADPRMRLDDVGKGIHFARKPLDPGVYFGSKHRAAVRQYYAQHPAAARGASWRIGQPVPKEAAVTPVPSPLQASLPKLPPGHRYVQVGGEVLLIAAESRMVVDGISRSP